MEMRIPSQIQKAFPWLLRDTDQFLAQNIPSMEADIQNPNTP